MEEKPLSITIQLDEAGAGAANESREVVEGEDEPTATSKLVVTETHVENALPDPGSAVASKRMRCLIFAMLCQGTQTFMSYDGGATPAVLDTIQSEFGGSWTTTEFGLLGAFDKIGMTASSMIWGRLLQLVNAKLLLVIGLGLNLAGSAVFGSLRQKELMHLCKFFLGVTQSLQGVWGTVWTVIMAPPQFKTVWLGLGAVSAGLGNGIGTGVAGFATANGLPYAFAFQVQAACLLPFLVYLIFVPMNHVKLHKFDTRVRAHSDDDTLERGQPDLERNSSKDSIDSKGRRRTTPTPSKGSSQLVSPDPRDVARAMSGLVPPSPSGTLGDALTFKQKTPDSLKSEEPLGVCFQLKELSKNKVYMWTAFAISASMFQVSGIQFLWVFVFTTVWTLSKNWVTLMFLLVTGIGGGIGIAWGPGHIDRSGGYGTSPGVLRSLKWLRAYAVLAVVSGYAGIGMLYGKTRLVDDGTLGPAGDAWLWLTWATIFLQWIAHNAAIPALCGINVEVVQSQMRTFSSGMEMTLRNILGYAAGPLLPGLVMDWLAKGRGWDVEKHKDQLNWQLSFGLGFVFSTNLLYVFSIHMATRAAGYTLVSDQKLAMLELQKAFASQDINRLLSAVRQAKVVELQRLPEGESVLGMANQVIGATSAEDRDSLFKEGMSAEDKFAQMQREVVRLQSELARLCTKKETPDKIFLPPTPNKCAEERLPLVCRHCGNSPFEDVLETI